MTDYSQKIAKAKASGYSDAEIATYLSSGSAFAPKIKQAKDAGYSDAEIIGHLSGSQQPQAPTATGGAGTVITQPLAPIAGSHVDESATPEQGGIDGFLNKYTPLGNKDFMDVIHRDSSALMGDAKEIWDRRTGRMAKGDFSGSQQEDAKDLLTLGGDVVNYGTSPINATVAALTRPGVRAANNAIVDSGRVVPSVALKPQQGSILPRVDVNTNIDRQQSFENLDNAVGTVGGIASMALGNESGALKTVKAAKPVKSALPVIPDVGALRTAKSAAYDKATSAGAVYSPKAVNQMVDDLEAAARADMIDPELNPTATKLLNRVQGLRDKPVTFNELEQTRKLINQNIDPLASPAEKHFGTMFKNHIDDFVDNAGPQHLVSGDAGTQAQAIKEARAANVKYRKAEAIDEALSKADRQAASSGTGGNIDNATRQRLRSLLENKRMSWTTDEKAAFEEVIRGGKMQNLLRLVGKLSPEGNGLMLAGQIGAAGLTHGASIPAAALGAAAKVGAEKMTQAKVESLLRTVTDTKTPVAQVRQAQTALKSAPPGVLSKVIKRGALTNTAANSQSVQLPALTAPSYATKAAAEPALTPQKKPEGQIEAGNIDLHSRHKVKNPDGSYSTVRSISVEMDGKTYLLPTVVGNRVVSNKEAIDHFKKTGEHLGAFKDGYSADKYAETLHEEQAKEYERQ